MTNPDIITTTSTPPAFLVHWLKRHFLGVATARQPEKLTRIKKCTGGVIKSEMYFPGQTEATREVTDVRICTYIWIDLVGRKVEIDKEHKVKWMMGEGK